MIICFINQLFLKLKKLTIWTENKDILLAILRNSSGITYLNLIVDIRSSCVKAEDLWSITKMTELEEFHIDFCKTNVKYLDYFVNQLKISCPKMRTVLMKTGYILVFPYLFNNEDLTFTAF